MYEFDSVSVSTYEAASLAAKLTEKSADGWEVVAIVPAGSDITAYVKRSADGARRPRCRRRPMPRSHPRRPPSRPPPVGADAVSEPSGWGTAPEAAAAASTSSWGQTATTETPAADSGGARTAVRLDRVGLGRSRGARRPPPPGAAGHAVGARRLVPRPGRPLRAALLGRLGVDRARVPHRPAVHRPARRLTAPPAGLPVASADADARHVDRPRRDPHRVRPRLDRLRPVVRPGVPRLVVPVPPQRPARRRPARRASRAPTTSTSRTSTATTGTSRGCATTCRRDIGVLLPGYPTRELDRTMRSLGFTNLIRTVDREELDLGGGLSVAIHVETSITDGPGGDSALVVSDGALPHRRPERLPHDRPRRPARARPGRPPLAAVQRGDLVPDGLRAARGRAAPARAGQGRQPAGAGDALRRVGRRPGRRAERRPAVLPRPRAVPPQRDRRRRAEHLRRPARVPRAPRRRRATTASWPCPGTTIDVTPDDIAVAHPVPTAARCTSSPTSASTSSATRPTGCRGSTT